MRTRIIRSGQAVQALTYGAYLLLVVTFLFGLDYGNITVSLACFGSLALGLVGTRFTEMSKTSKQDAIRVHGFPRSYQVGGCLHGRVCLPRVPSHSWGGLSFRFTEACFDLPNSFT